MRGYILTVTAAAILAAIVREIAGNGTMGALVKFLAGLFVALTVLSPLVEPALPDLDQWFSDFRYDGSAAAAAGKEMAQAAEHEIIKEQVEAYILDKAAACGAVVQVEAVLNEEGVPVSVMLQGDVSPAARAALSRIMGTELGLGEEVQHWNESISPS